MEFWQLPGPSRFLDAVIDVLVDGRVCFIHIPKHAPAGLRIALRQRLYDNIGLFQEISEPRDELVRYLEAEVPETDRAHAPRVGTEFLSAKLAGSFFWVEATERGSVENLTNQLLEFGKIAQSRSSGEYPRFLIVLSGDAAKRDAVTNESTLVHLIWDGYVEPIDMQVYAAYTFRGGSSDWMDRLAGRIAGELAGSDPDLLDALRAVPYRTLTDPSVKFTEIAATRGWAGAACWEEGSVSVVNGRDSVHSCHPSCDLVQYRIWAAQVSELFPVLEIRRFEAIRRFRRFLTVPTIPERSFVRSIEDLEFTDIVQQLGDRGHAESTRGSTELALMRRWRNIRNKLAHGEIVEFGEINDRLFRALSDWSDN